MLGAAIVLQAGGVLIHDHLQVHSLTTCRAAVEGGSNARPHHRTLSMAVSSAAIDNVQSNELATAMAGQIARTAAIFNVDEVIVIDESAGPR